MRTSLCALLIATVCLLLPAPGCGDDETFVPPPVPPGDYARIVSLTPSITEMIFALGAGDRLVGVTTWCDYPPEARRLTRVGDFVRPNLEKLVSLEPDLVVLAPTGDLLRESYENMTSLGLTVLVVWDNTLEESLQAIRDVGRTLNIDEEAAALEDRLRQGLSRERERFADTATLRVLWVMGRRPLVAVGRETFQHELLEGAGCVNVAGDLGAWPVLSTERVLAFDPDVIIDSAMDVSAGDLDQEADPWQRFTTLAAVRDGRVHFLDHDALYRPGPRMVEAQVLVGRTLFPELYNY